MYKYNIYGHAFVSPNGSLECWLTSTLGLRQRIPRCYIIFLSNRIISKMLHNVTNRGWIKGIKVGEDTNEEVNLFLIFDMQTIPHYYVGLEEQKIVYLKSLLLN